MENLNALAKTFLMAINQAQDLPALEDLRIQILGKKGEVTRLLKSLGSLDPIERKGQGQSINHLKDKLLQALTEKKEALAHEAMNKRMAQEQIDITLEGTPKRNGTIHPVSQTLEEVIAIFGDMGFRVAEGPEIEEDGKNFDALNIAPDHPARQEQDTFYFNPREDGTKMLLRTHTSPVQIRTMLNETPPIKIIAPGRVYRSDFDLTHTPMFHQVEGLYVGKGITMAHLKGCLISFLQTFFNNTALPIRFRPSYFPFTEPSAEVDIGCERHEGEFKIGTGQGWLEILGCGMVHPNVLENCDLDPKEYQGFAFGMGLERITMLKYGIPDLRTFFEGDLRWLHHYGFDFYQFPCLLNGLGHPCDDTSHEKGGAQ